MEKELEKEGKYKTGCEVTLDPFTFQRRLFMTMLTSPLKVLTYVYTGLVLVLNFLESDVNVKE